MLILFATAPDRKGKTRNFAELKYHSRKNSSVFSRRASGRKTL